VANSFPILGAIVADCWVGKYGTIVFFTLIYICGLLIISITGKSISYFVSTRGFMHFLDNIPDYSYALPKIRILVGNPDERPKKWNLTRQVPVVHSKSPDYSLYNVRPGPHVLEDMKTVINAARGEIYTILKFLQNGSLKKNEVYEITQRNKPNALWQLPQDIFFFIGQIMVHPNSFEFAYTQAPIHMKTLMTTFFLWLATFFGSRLNDIFVLMPEFDNQVSNIKIIFPVYMTEVCSRMHFSYVVDSCWL
jgi:dipeptide/tripeptide permease